MKGTIKDKYLESLKKKDLAQTLRFKAHENFALKEGSVSVVDLCLCVQHCSAGSTSNAVETNE